MDVFQSLPSNSVPLCLTSWENQKNKKKKIVDLHKSGSSLGAISKCLKVLCSSVQTIVCKYKHHGTTQPSYHSGRRCVLSPRDERTFVRKMQINPRTTAKDLGEDAGGNGYKSIYIHSKTSPISTQPERPLSKEESTASKPP